MDLIKRREEIIAEHTAQQKYHPHWKTEASAGRLIAERPIAFICDDEVVVLGEDVAKVLAGIKQFVEKHGSEFDDPTIQAAKMHDFNCLKRCKKLLAAPPNGDLRVSQNVWNAYAFGLGEVGVFVVLTDGTFAQK